MKIKQAIQNIYTEPKIYFLLHLSSSTGLGDRLSYWRRYYDICTSMGWNYVHQPLDTKRSDPNNNIFDFLGFNDALSELFPADENVREAKIINISLMSKFGLGNLSSSKDVQDVIMCKVRWQLYRSHLKLLLPWILKTGERRRAGPSAIVVHMFPPRGSNYGRTGPSAIVAHMFPRGSKYHRSVNTILHRIAILHRIILHRILLRVLLRVNPIRALSRNQPPQNGGGTFAAPSTQLSSYLRRAYEEARIKHPYPSKFKSGKIKVLIQVRQGDIGVIRTPAQQWIVKGQVLDSLRDFKGKFPVIAAEEYLPMAKQLLQWIHPNDSSIFTSSDGYGKTFSDIYYHQEKHPFLTKDQLRELWHIQDTYEERVFKPFSDISNIAIGENYDNLRHLVNACIEADIIICRSSAPLLLLSTYRRLETPHPPMLIYLTRKINDVLYTSARPDIPNILYIDIDNPEDFDNIKKKYIRDHIEAIRLRIRSGNNRLETN